MDTQLSFPLPKSFKNLVYGFPSEIVTIVCKNGEENNGSLIDVTPKSIVILTLETYSVRELCNLDDVFYVIVHGIDERTVKFIYDTSAKLYKKFKLFLGNEIEIVQTNKPEIKVAGKLLYLGKDYFILSNAYEKKIFCVFCDGNDVIVRRIN